MKTKKITRSKNKSSNNRRSQSIIGINFVMIILFVITILFLRNLYIYFLRNKTLTVQKATNYESIIDAKALIIRNEYVYSKNKSIDFKQEDRVPVNFPLGSIKKFENNTGYENSNLSEKIEELRMLQANYTEYNKKRENISNTVFSLKEAIKNESIRSANKIIKDNLMNININLEELEVLIRQLELIKEIQEKQGSNLVSMNPGVYSEKIDGFETIYNYTNKDQIYALVYQSFSTNPSQSGFKIIDNSEVALRFSVKTKDLLNRYTNGSEIQINFNGDRISGNIDRIDLIGDNTAFTVTIREKPYLFQDQRFTDIQLINYTTKVFKLPTKSMAYKNDQAGYYIRESSGIVRFIPVDIIKEDGRQSYIKAGVNGEILINGKHMKSLKEFDEIIKNPNLVKEGMILE